MDEEVRLVEAARGGSVGAFSQLLRLYQAHLRAYIAGFIRDSQAVDDIAQEALLGAYRNLNTFRGESPFKTWLFAIAKNSALMHLRDEARRQSHRTDSLRFAVSTWLTQAAEGEDGDVGAVQRELTTLDGCIEKLPRMSATLVAEYYRNRRTAGEIAERTGKSEAAVWKTLSRIRQALRQCVEFGLSAKGIAP
jgi:RNA polymerase sigma-70 factor (ECF subfamily)